MRPITRRTAAGIALGSVVLIVVAAVYAGAGGPGPRRPDFTLADLDGQPRSIDEFDGRVVVLNFWASWCAPCRREIPMLVAAEKAGHARGLRIVGIAIDEPAAARRFARRYAIDYPVLADPVAGARIQDAYTADARSAAVLPYTVVIDRDGRIAARVAGALTRERLDALVAPLLGATADPPT